MWGQNLARTRFPAMVCNGGHQSGQSAAARNDEYWICSIPTVWQTVSGRLTKGTAGDDHHDIE